MIKLRNIILRRGGHILLDNATLSVYPGHHVGLIGSNGSGKTSLFKLLLGEIAQDQGDIEIPKQWKIAHMAQEVSYREGSARDFVIDGDQELREIQAKLAQAEAKNNHQAQAALYEQLDTIDGYSAQYRAEQLLHGLGFTQSQVENPVSDFSGGWRIRLNLARTLMCRSDMLLLDEPTNHLDIDACLWLEQWLKSYQGTLLLISHDRDFLDQVVNTIVSIEHTTLNHYSGNYSDYEQQRAERLALQQAAYQKQQQRIAEINRFVTRFKAKASKAKQAQSRIKELSRMQTIAPAHIDSPFHFIFSPADKVSDPLIGLKQAALGYRDKTVLSNVDLNLHPGTRIGLLGYNGAGKSTLIKSLVGELPLLQGERVCGLHLRIGYFAQHQLEALDLQASPLLHIQRLSPAVNEQAIRNFLGGFDFHGDKALQAIEPFSGGEKARLALALVVWQRPNLLLLDEPTNHLDLEMRYALTVALQSYQGALIVISHDRHLLRNTVDQYYRVADGRVEEYDGTLDDYQRWLIALNKQSEKSIDSNNKKLDKRAQRQKAALQRHQKQPLTNRLKKIEQALQTAQKDLAGVEQQLADGETYHDKNKQRLQQILTHRGELNNTIAELEEAWLQVQEQLEQLE